MTKQTNLHLFTQIMFNHYICIVLSTYQDFKQTSGSLHLNLIIFQALYGPLTKTSDRHVPVMTILKTSSSEKDIFYNICIHLVPIIILSRKHRRPKKTFFLQHLNPPWKHRRVKKTFFKSQVLEILVNSLFLSWIVLLQSPMGRSYKYLEETCNNIA